MLTSFQKDESGAITVDWVVMTAAVIGLTLATAAAVATGISGNVDNTAAQLTGQEISTSFGTDAGLTTAFNGMTTNDYITYGQGIAPGNNGAVYGLATQLAQENAPDGYNFDNPLHESSSNNLVYTSNDGQNYSIGGVVTPIDSYTGTASYFGA